MQWSVLDSGSSGALVSVPPPPFGILSPLANSYVSGAITVSGTCYADGLSGVTIGGSGVALGAAPFCAPDGTFSAGIMLSPGDGTKNVAISQIDPLGASADDNRDFVVDTTAPSISIGSPGAGASVSAGVTVTGACEAGLTVTFSGTSSPSPATTVCAAGSFSQAITLGASDGTVTLLASQTDAAGNTGSPGVSLTKDTAAPAPAFATPAAGTVTGATVDITGSCEAGLTVSIGGTGTSSSTTTSCAAGSFLATMPLTAGDGTKNITIGQTDAAGNTGTANRDFVRDTTAPALAISSPGNGNTVSGAITLSGTCETGLTVNIGGTSTPSPGTTSCAGGAFSQAVTLAAADGSRTITVAQTDGTANTGSANITVTKDTSAPPVAITAPAANTPTATSISMSGTCEAGLTVTFGGTGHSSPATASCGAGTFSAAIVLSAGDGTKNITASQTDSAGNTGSSNRNFVLDGTAPTVTATSPANGITRQSSVTVSGACETGLTVSFSGTSLPSPASVACVAGAYSQLEIMSASDGPVTVIATQTDAVGNVGSVTRSITKDTTPPTLTLSTPADGSLVTASVLATGTCETGLTVTFAGDSTPTPTTTSCAAGSFSQSLALGGAEGSVILTASQTDAGGNVGSASNALTKDTVAPAPAFSAPAAGTAIVSGMTITGTCETGLTVSVGGTGNASPATTSCSGGTFLMNTGVTAGDGTKNITLSQTDAAGNTGTANRNFVRDTAAPVLTISSPADGSATQNAITLTGTCETGLTVNIGGTSSPSPTTATCVAGAFSRSLVLLATDGSRTITAAQTDTAGNTGSTSITVTLDTTGPGLSIVTPANGSTVGATEIVAGACETGVAVQFTGTSSPSPASTACTAGAYSQLVTFGAADGVRSLNVGQTDAAGNLSSLGVNLTKDTSSPALTITSPAAGAFSTGSVFVTGTCLIGTPVSLSGTGNASPAPTACSAGAFSASVTLTAGDGSKLITATQGASNTSRGFNRDNTAPAVTFTTPGTQYGGQNAALSFSSVDAGIGTNILEIDFAPDGVTYGTQYGVASGATSLGYPMPMVNTATGTFRLHSTDLLGNTVTVTRGPIPVLSVLGRYPAATKWNDYFRVSTPAIACSGAETGSSNPCIHGGDKLTVIAGDRTSCADLSAEDQLGAFDWRCEIVNGSAYLTSRLRPGKGLRDLLSTTPSWTANAVTILDGGSPIYATPIKVWWTNTVSPLPSSSASAQTLTGSGLILVASSNMTSRGYNLDSDHMALVTLAGARITASGAGLPSNCNDLTGEAAGANSPCLIAAGSQNFLWIEADLDGVSGAGTNNGVWLSGVKFSVVELSRIVNMGYEALILRGGSRYNRARDIQIANSNHGLTVDGSSDNTFSGFGISNVMATDRGALSLTAPANGNTFSGFLIHGGSGANAIHTADAAGSYSGNSFSMMTIANTSDLGLHFSGLQESFVHNVMLVSIAQEGLSLGGGGVQQVTDNTFSQLAIGDSKTLVSLSTGVAGNKFTGNLLLGSFSTARCAGGDLTAGINASCSPTNASDFAIRTGVLVSSAVLGKVSATDPSNLSNSGGVSSFASISDWLDFSNLFRGWGRDGGIFPQSSNQGACASGTCRIWDWRLRLSDTELLNTSEDGFNQNAAFLDGVACPVSGASYLSNPSDGIFYLKSAVELLGDDAGNDNGLCESEEVCLYTPNFGAYQGEGPLGRCAFSDGVVTGVTLVGYLSNGG